MAAVSKNQKRPKKTESIHIRFPEKTKVLVEGEAKRNFRSFQDEVIALVAEALHAREFNIEKYI